MKKLIGSIGLTLSFLLVSCSNHSIQLQKPKFDSFAQVYGRTLASVGYTEIQKSKRRIVVLKKGASSPSSVARRVGKKYGVRSGHVYKHALRGFSISLSDEAVTALLKDSEIAYIANDKPKKAIAQSIPSGISRSGAHKNKTANIGGSTLVNVDVAVIDTGVDINHPDLNVYRSVNFAKGKTADDGNGHGTHVAGTIGAKDNSEGVVGMAPGARIWGVRVLDNRGSGWSSDIIAGIDYVTANASEIEVANMSLGGAGSDDGNCGNTNNDPEHQAICASVAAGVVYVVAAGNETDDSSKHTPAAYDEVITVSALADSDGAAGANGAGTSYGADDSLASFSNFGADVDIAAPGVDITSTWKDGGYNTISGTSMASPHVAGAAALFMAKEMNAGNARPTVAAVKTALLDAAWDQGSSFGFSGDSDGYSEPLLNAEALDPAAPPAPGVQLSLSADKSTYRTDLGDVNASITARVSDELGNPIEQLTALDFSSSLNGSPVSLNFSEQSPGEYSGVIALGADGNYTLSTTTTDTRSLAGSANTSYTVSSVAAPEIFVSGIDYSTTGGKSGDRNLLITITIQNTENQAVEAASVSIELYQGSIFVGSATAQTGLTGTVTFNLRNAATGCYNTTVSDVSKSGEKYDSTKNITDEGFCK